jgi:hypothetical protein
MTGMKTSAQNQCQSSRGGAALIEHEKGLPLGQWCKDELGRQRTFLRPLAVRKNGRNNGVISRINLLSQSDLD